MIYKTINVTDDEMLTFWQKVNKDGSPWTNPQTGETSLCWEWMGRTNHNGYGIFDVHSKSYFAHRVSWEKSNKASLGQYQACHSCDNPLCVNPNHLWRGTMQENTADRDAKGRTARGERTGVYTHPENRVHFFGTTNPRGKLTDAQVRQIKDLRNKRVPRKVIADMFQIHGSTVSNIANGKRRNHAAE